KGVPIRRAARENGVPRQTLNDLNLREGEKRGHEKQARLSPEQENKVVRWILLQEKLGYAPSHNQIRSVVVSVSRQNGDTSSLGNRFMERFIKRHPEIKTKIGKRIDYQRING